MNAIAPDELLAEIETDPKGLGYATPRAGGNLVAIQVLLDATDGPGAETITLPAIDSGTFLLGIRSAYGNLPNLDATIQSKWDRFLSSIRSQPSIVLDAQTFAFLALAVSDGVIAQAEVDALGKRPGSRAEVLWGAGVVVSIRDLEIALNGAG